MLYENLPARKPRLSIQACISARSSSSCWMSRFLSSISAWRRSIFSMYGLTASLKALVNGSGALICGGVLWPVALWEVSCGRWMGREL